MTVAKRLSVGLVLTLLVVVPSVANAEDAKADALFKEGRALLDQKRYDEACAKLAESHRLEPGAGTLLALALCHEGQGKTATAHTELEEAATLGRKNGRAELAKAAEKRAAAMGPALSRVVVRMPEASSEYEVKLDGQPVAREALRAPIAVDPGEHRAEVSAKGKAPRGYVVRLSGAGTVEIVVDQLEDAARPAPAVPAEKSEKPAPKPAVAGPRDARSFEVEPPAADSGSGRAGGAQRAIGLSFVGLGVTGLAVGGYFGGRAISEHNRAGQCSSPPCSDANEANDSSRSAARMAVISGTAGFVAIGAGTILYLTAPKSSSRSAEAKPLKATARVVPEAGPTGLGVGVVGSF